MKNIHSNKISINNFTLNDLKTPRKNKNNIKLSNYFNYKKESIKFFSSLNYKINKSFYSNSLNNIFDYKDNNYTKKFAYLFFVTILLILSIIQNSVLNLINIIYLMFYFKLQLNLFSSYRYLKKITLAVFIINAIENAIRIILLIVLYSKYNFKNIEKDNNLINYRIILIYPDMYKTLINLLFSIIVTLSLITYFIKNKPGIEFANPFLQMSEEEFNVAKVYIEKMKREVANKKNTYNNNTIKSSNDDNNNQMNKIFLDNMSNNNKSCSYKDLISNLESRSYLIKKFFRAKYYFNGHLIIEWTILLTITIESLYYQSILNLIEFLLVILYMAINSLSGFKSIKTKLTFINVLGIVNYIYCVVIYLVNSEQLLCIFFGNTSACEYYMINNKNNVYFISILLDTLFGKSNKLHSFYDNIDYRFCFLILLKVLSILLYNILNAGYNFFLVLYYYKYKSIAEYNFLSLKKRQSKCSNNSNINVNNNINNFSEEILYVNLSNENNKNNSIFKKKESVLVNNENTLKLLNYIGKYNFNPLENNSHIFKKSRRIYCLLINNNKLFRLKLILQNYKYNKWKIFDKIKCTIFDNFHLNLIILRSMLILHTLLIKSFFSIFTLCIACLSTFLSSRLNGNVKFLVFIYIIFVLDLISKYIFNLSVVKVYYLDISSSNITTNEDTSTVKNILHLVIGDLISFYFILKYFITLLYANLIRISINILKQSKSNKNKENSNKNINFNNNMLTTINELNDLSHRQELSNVFLIDETSNKDNNEKKKKNNSNSIDLFINNVYTFYVTYDNLLLKKEKSKDNNSDYEYSYQSKFFINLLKSKNEFFSNNNICKDKIYIKSKTELLLSFFTNSFELIIIIIMILLGVKAINLLNLIMMFFIIIQIIFKNKIVKYQMHILFVIQIIYILEFIGRVLYPYIYIINKAKYPLNYTIIKIIVDVDSSQSDLAYFIILFWILNNSILYQHIIHKHDIDKYFLKKKINIYRLFYSKVEISDKFNKNTSKIKINKKEINIKKYSENLNIKVNKYKNYRKAKNTMFISLQPSKFLALRNKSKNIIFY